MARVHDPPIGQGAGTATADDDGRIMTVAALEALYGPVVRPSIVKETDHLRPAYRPFIATAPFVLLATTGPAGPDVTPRGDAAGFVEIGDDRALFLPDRRGNNRIDGLGNIVADPRVALLFLIPGIGETLRVSGTAEILAGADIRARFAVAGRPPATVLRIHVDRLFFQCARAVIRAGLWQQDSRIARDTLPGVGRILNALSAAEVGGDACDRALPGRLADTLYRRQRKGRRWQSTGALLPFAMSGRIRPCRCRADRDARRCGPTCRCDRAGNTVSRDARHRDARPRSNRCSANRAGRRARRPRRTRSCAR